MRNGTAGTARAVLGLLAIGLALECSGQDLSRAIVRIFAKRPGVQGTSLGAGVFISATGDVLTAYHVIQGASKIDVYSGTKECPGVQLLAYDETQDLARIHCTPPAQQATFAVIGNVPPNLLAVKAEAIGFPDGKPLSHLPVSFLQGSPISGAQYFVDGKQIFSQDAFNVQLLNIDATLPPGMSGAPVVVDGRVIAVVSGSEAVRSRAPGWAMIAANERSIKAAVNPQRFDLTPKLTMLLSQYSYNTSLLMKVSLAPEGAEPLIIGEERLEVLRTMARDLDDEYRALLDKVVAAYEFGPNSVVKGTDGSDVRFGELDGSNVLFGRLFDNALAAADEHERLFQKSKDFLFEAAASVAEGETTQSETYAQLQKIAHGSTATQLSLPETPDMLIHVLSFLELQHSDEDMGKAIEADPVAYHQDSIRKMRADLQELVSKAPHSIEATEPDKSHPVIQFAAPRCPDCVVKSAALLKSIAFDVVDRRLRLSQFILTLELQQKKTQALIRISSDSAAVKAGH